MTRLQVYALMTILWSTILGFLVVFFAQKCRRLRRELRSRDGWWTCDACSHEFGPEVENGGHECDLCADCAKEPT